MPPSPKTDNLAVIPARGGSKRLPRKNVRPLAGRPLLAYSIEAARDSGLFARVVVSTDDPEIAAVAERYGAEVPFLREPALADDHTPVSAATRDALERLDPHGDRYALVAQLMPNCPLRDAEDVRASHAHFATHPYASQVSVTRYGWLNPWWALELGDDSRVSGLFAERLAQRSQDLPALYCPTGAVWWIEADALRAHGTYHLPERGAFVLPWQHAVDIDDADDWALAELLAAGERSLG